MKKLEITTDWLQNMAFETEVDGHKVVTDIPIDRGGENLGPGPKHLMMVALTGCTGIDVVSILKKMRMNLKSFRMKVSGHLADEEPNAFVDMHVVYECVGDNLSLEKIQKVVTLSEDKYCGVRATLAHSVKFSSEIIIKNE